MITGAVAFLAGAMLNVEGAAAKADPVTYKGTFARTGSMVQPRIGAQSLVLKDGRVLVIGGRSRLSNFGDPDYESYLKSAEIYDPETAKFTTTGSMNKTRISPQIVLLNDGRVLVAGGSSNDPLDDGHETEKSAEIYDPTSGQFTLTADSGADGPWDTATVLADGRVILTGFSFANQQVIAELFDPASGTFSSTGAPLDQRPEPGSVLSEASSVLLNNGKVLFAGGSEFDNNLCSASGLVPNSQIYDPVSGTFSLSSPMVTPRSDPEFFTRSDGRIVMLGGSVPRPDVDPSTCLRTGAESAEIYDPTGASFSTFGLSPIGGGPDEHFSRPYSFLDDNRILVITGENVADEQFGEDPYPLAFIGNVSEGREQGDVRTGPMTAPHLGGIAETLDSGLVLVAGGAPSSEFENLDYEVNGVAELFDQSRNPPPRPRRNFTAIGTFKVTPRKKSIRRGKKATFKVLFTNTGDSYLQKNKVCASYSRANRRHLRVAGECDNDDRIGPGKTGTTKFQVVIKKKAKKGKTIPVKFVLKTSNLDPGDPIIKSVLAKVKIK